MSDRSPADAALEKFIESKIPANLRENYGHDISMIRGGWHAALEFVQTLRYVETLRLIYWTSLGRMDHDSLMNRVRDLAKPFAQPPPGMRWVYDPFKPGEMQLEKIE